MEKRLYRIKNKGALLGGVSQGLSEYFNIDVTLIRVVFVLLFFTPVPAFFAYFILWVVLPVKYDYGYAGVSEVYNSTNDINSQSGETSSNFNFMSRNNQNNNLVGGAILIILGIIFSFKTFFHINLFHYIGQMWPLILVGIGVWLIIKDKKDDNFTNFTNNDSTNL
ncbi:phage shock protein C, PspC [Emticicia oligotrophica DSM 17448]|uniref:Phage shock protein C, PspC n=1 Tax=Emticicia oligotrophica (strain DSM 17448 / CIP 109782 / MTCC 6937 / GPTSA100-15) TaxID=929562 RepID=A0ABN4AQW6_EMTOG|nr:PspC domain-containing protein [Emticicia oligotrophica]AFK04849.1 phage shock protein C, PspC [Emticicia oligotrophica DSM 17448]